MNYQIVKIKNKKGDLSIVVFVFLVLLLCGYTLFVIISSRSKSEQKVSGFAIASEFLLEQKELEYRLTKLGEECIVNSLGEVGKTYSGTEYESWLKERNKENLTEKIESCLKEKSGRFSSDLHLTKAPLIRGFFARIKDDSILMVEENHKEIKIILKNFPLSWLRKDNIYETDLSTTIAFNKIGLIHPQEFKKIIECNREEKCILEKTRGLIEVKISEEEVNNKKYERYSFETNKKFLIDGKFQKVNFVFVVPIQSSP